ncbi:MAG: bifunctional 4-hydroxy-2-oxoglutarate aldolase/2-dehydro-3-deoxy-phosphogluconate aldolase [Lachnospiraceae bacterium]|jgi:2-dehydro-3-deoxyphosphogluconate aldolase/(4S)-4-hydroxy-2-oxoglutarate aldolase|nr:bifunctional 4-hydroxy-2-oxoglutarate aldolase/2-dehydro-3-deoxy-phosphogluconate aldolase [Lachnospiraceae bacterium]
MDMYPIVIEHPLLAILRKIPLEKTIDYAQAVVNGGVSFFEVALNSPDGLKQISMLRDHFGDSCLIGAGTAITVERAKAALDAGAQFLLTPGTPPDVLEYCAKNEIKLLPGVLSPCDVALALEFGFKTMKLFPAGSMPRSYVKDLKGPFDDTNYMAIGGVSPDNIREFFDAGCIAAGLASSLMPKDVVASSDWERGSAYIKRLVDKIKGGN